MALEVSETGSAAVPVEPVSLADIRAAHERLSNLAIRSPTIRCNGAPDGMELYLKLESLQPVGSFKIRPIGHAVLTKDRAALGKGMYTASSGNAALNLAWMARRIGVPAAALVAEHTAGSKLERLRELGARIVTLSPAAWWETILAGGHPNEPGIYIDGVRDPAALAGDATIGIEILGQLPDLDAIFVPVGGGGLASSIACAVRALGAKVKVIGCELSSANPLESALKAGRPVTIPFDSGFITGLGYGSVLAEMWPLLKQMIDGVVTVSIREVADAIRVLARRNNLIAEGAGAASVAAALSGRHPFRRICAVISGGNLDPEKLVAILNGQTPT